MRTIVVDKNDRVLGIKGGNEVTHDDIYRVSALWLTNSKKQVLIARRNSTKQNDPGKWGPAVSGTLEESETYESNIYKEAEEEIGLTGVEFQPKTKIFNDDKFRYFVQWFTCQVDWPLSKFRPQKSEVEKLAWIDKAVLLKDVRDNPKKYIKTAYRFNELFKD